MFIDKIFKEKFFSKNPATSYFSVACKNVYHNLLLKLNSLSQKADIFFEPK